MGRDRALPAGMRGRPLGAVPRVRYSMFTLSQLQPSTVREFGEFYNEYFYF